MLAFSFACLIRKIDVHTFFFFIPEESEKQNYKKNHHHITKTVKDQTVAAVTIYLFE
jgi:hypothetical protein